MSDKGVIMALYAIGDIHGNLCSLQTIFNHIAYSKDDIFVFLGDYIDRGPASKQVIDFIMDLSQKTNVIPLMGNHEAMMYFAKDDAANRGMWLQCGGVQTLDSYNAGDINEWVSDIPKEHWAFIENLRIMYITDKYIFAHASFEANTEFTEQDPNILLWQNTEGNIQHQSGKTLVVGHTPQLDHRVKFFENTILADSFSFAPDGWLSCINLTEYENGEEFCYVQANEKGEFRRRAGDLPD